MPNGTFASDLTPDNRAGGSITGTGAPSNPRAAAWYNDTPGSTGYTSGADNPRYGQTLANQSLAANRTGNQTAFSSIQNTTDAQVQGLPGLYGLPGQVGGGQPIGGNPLYGAQQLANTLYGPQQTLLGQQLARQYDQLGQVNLDADYKTDALNRDAALARQGLGIDRQGLGADAGLTKTQLANNTRLRAILGKQYGLAGEQLANQLAGLGIDEATARDSAKRNLFDLRSTLTGRGAFNTVANERGTGRVNRDLMYQLGGINNQRAGADINYRGNVLGLDEKGIGLDNSTAGLNNRLAHIGLDVSRLGIQEQQLANSLQDGLHQIGMDSMVSINGLLDAIGGTNAQQAQLATTILTEVMGYADLPPDVLTALQAALGVAPGQQQPNTQGQTVPGSRIPL